VTRTAVLLLDLQVDFLDVRRGKMPVDPAGALRVIAATNAVLRAEVPAGVLPVLIVDAFPPIATDASWKVAFAAWSLRRAGVTLLGDVEDVPRVVPLVESAPPRHASRS
jgi:hypothetical protein